MSNFVIIAVGSNLGDKLKNLSDCYLNLFEHVNIKSISPIYQSPALLPEDALKSWDIDFYNSVLYGYTKLSSNELHKKTLEIEKLLGKDHKLSGRWAPRLIDIDIIAFNNEIIDEDNLKIPHPRMLQRDFVMLPLNDILPDWTHPNLKQNISQYINNNFKKTDAKKINLNSQTKLQGILNITPDSFSDGGKYNNRSSAKTQIEKMIVSGVDIIDIGAESTRPDAEILTLDEEWRRLKSVLEVIPKENNVRFSLDSRNYETQLKAQEYNIDIINDVTGFESNKMLDLAVHNNKEIIFMHSLTIPADKEITIPADEDVVEVLMKWAEEKIKYFKKQGLDKSQIIFDPGLGFGKTAQQSWEIIKRVDEFKKLGVKILIGHSEKSFLTLFTNKKAGERISETLTISSILLHKNIDYLRIHNVEKHHEMMNVF